jgi:hypothetical protein
VRGAEGVPQDELQVLGGAQAGVEGVAGGDGLAQHAGDGLRLAAVLQGPDLIQVPGQLHTLLPPALRTNRRRWRKRRRRRRDGEKEKEEEEEEEVEVEGRG